MRSQTIKVFKTQAKLFLPAPSDLPSQKEVTVVSSEHPTSFADPDQLIEKRLRSRALSASQPLDQGFQSLEEYLSASRSAPVSPLISAYQPLDQHLSAA